MWLDTFLIRMQNGQVERPKHIKSGRWSGMLKFYETRLKIGESFDMDFYDLAERLVNKQHAQRKKNHAEQKAH